MLCLTISVLSFSGILSSCLNEPSAGTEEANALNQDFKVVGYLMASNFDKIDLIELDRLTHLNLAFANPDQQGNLVFGDDTDIRSVLEKGHEHGLEVFISIAGGGNPDKQAWMSALNPTQRSVFINNIVSFVEANNLDGVDVDIEWNLLPTIGNLYTPFVVELSAALGEKGKSITTALGASGLHEAVTDESLAAYDFINVMVYDKTGIWEPDVIGPHSPYSYAEEAIQYWTKEREIPAERIVLGVPFYGIDFAKPPRYLSYRDLIKEDPSNAYRDSVDLKYFNGLPTVIRKTELAKKELGGVMIWEISQDTIGPVSLLRGIDQTIRAEN